MSSFVHEQKEADNVNIQIRVLTILIMVLFKHTDSSDLIMKSVISAI